MNALPWLHVVATLGGSLLAAADAPKMPAKAALLAASGATVATASFDAGGHCRFIRVPPGEYRLLVTRADGRSVTIGDLDGDGRPELVVEASGQAADYNSSRSNRAAAPQADFNTTRSNKDKAASATGVRPPRSFVCVVGWDGTVKGHASLQAARRSAQGPSGGAVLRISSPAPGEVLIEGSAAGAHHPGP